MFRRSQTTYNNFEQLTKFLEGGAGCASYLATYM